MALKKIFNSMKHDKQSLIARLDKFLVVNQEENDRAKNVNSPSMAGRCMRANYYARTGEGSQGLIDARTQRIFDNGTYTHERLQDYLKKEGTLIFDEVPLIDYALNIQGHTDGLLKLSQYKYAILEIKSINSNGFSKLKDAKEEHKLQAMVYLYCMENRRKQLKLNNPNGLEGTLEDRRRFYESRYSHIRDGKTRTREEKINFQVELNLKIDEILYKIPKEIDTIVFLYENKDTQELKEFEVKYDESMMNGLIEYYCILNEHVHLQQVPPKEGTSKSCTICRWCNFATTECWLGN